MLQNLLNSGQAISVNTAISTKEYEEQKTVSDLYNAALEDISAIIESNSKPLCHVPTSMGKDSLLVLLMTIKAYSESIRLGLIEKSRPLIATTVDTQVESVPMQMMVRYIEPRLRNFATSMGVNLQFSVLKPRLTDEYFIRWGSGQKLLGNPSRNGDCSKILKIDVSERHLRGLSDQLAKQGYQHSPICSLLGSRDAESTRRSKNIDKANLRENPLSQMKKIELGRGNIYQYAPIRHWTDEQVFLYHQLAGSEPMTRSVLGNTVPLFDTFFPNHGLTLAIYGNGTNETCQVIVGQSNNAGCGGKSARFGCYVCPQTGTFDKSSEALAEHPRWAALGGDKALKVRDWLYRLSTSLKSRAFHAKAIDEVGFNRISLQPNVLKARLLEKMVWHASRLSVESEQIAFEFRQLVAKGREMEHAGMQDIQNDESLTPGVKQQFLDMYREVAQQPLYECFSERHALMLSFRWLIDGVATTSFKPISIYQRVLDGERLPLPMTNREYEAKYGKISMRNNLPDAVMIPFHTQAFEKEFHPLHSPRFLSYWQRPFGVLDLFDKEANCSIENVAVNTMQIEVMASCEITDSGEYIPAFEKPKMNGRLLPKLVENMVSESVLTYLTKHYEDRAEAMFDKPFDEIKEDLATNKKVSLSVPFLSNKQIGLQSSYSEAKTKAYNEKTERVIVRKGGKIHRTTTRMNFYPPKKVPASLINKLVPVESLALNFAQEERFTLSIRDDNWQNEADLVLDNLVINERTFNQWLSIDGWEKALKTHDTELKNRLFRVKQTRGQGLISRQIRVYGGSVHAHDLLRTSGIEIAPKYENQLRTTLKRTDLFDEIGVYDYAAISHDQLLALDNTISMKQHRKDKIQCVQAIRQHRNKMRRFYQAMAKRDYSSIIERHFENITEALDEVIKGLFNVLGGHIDTAEPPTPQRLAASRMVLGMNSPSLTNVDACMKSLFSSATIDVIKSNPALMISLVNEYRRQLESVHTRIASLNVEWRSKANALLTFGRQIEMDDTLDHNGLWVAFQEKHNHYAQTQPTYYPEWRASRESKIVHIENKASFINKVLVELSGLNTIIEKSIETSGSNAVKSLSVKDKLAFLKVVA